MSRRVIHRWATLAGVSLVLLGAVEVSGQGLELSDRGIGFPDGTMLTSARGRGLGYANVLVVAKSGGQFTSIQAALDAIGGIGPYGQPLPEATEENPYLVWVAPGIYEERVSTKSWVDVEGAGRGVTVVRYPAEVARGTTLSVASNSEVRSLTVENSSGGIGIGGSWCGGIAVEDVSVLLAEGGTGLSYWCLFPLTDPHAAAGARYPGPELQDVTIRVTGGQSTRGIWVAGVGLRMHGVHVRASHGTESNTAIEAFDQGGLETDGLVAEAVGTNAVALDWSGSLICPTPGYELRNAIFFGDVVIGGQIDCPGVLIRDSTIDGDLELWDSGGDYIGVTNTILTGEAVGAPAGFRCFSVFDRHVRPLDENCQPIP